MVFVVCSISAILAILSLLRHSSDRKNPIFIFCIFWAIIVFSASFYWLGYNRVSDSTWSIILVGIVSYAFGGFLMGLKKIRSVKRIGMYRPNRANLLGTIGVVFTFSKLMRAVPYLLKTMSFAALRKEYWIIGGSITTGTLDYIFDNFFNSGISLAITVVAFTELFSGKRRNYLLLCSIFMNFASALCSGGRMILLNLVISLMGGFWLSGNGSFRELYRSLAPRYKRLLKGLLLGGVIVLAILTFARQGGSYSVIEALYSYYTLEMSLFDHTLRLLSSAGDITYGAITTMGFTQPIAMIIQFLGFIKYPEIYNTLAKYTSPYFEIGGVGKYNAFVTQFFYFYLDGRIFGVIIFDIIIGMIYMYYYKRVREAKDNKYIAVYLIIVINILQSGFRFSFSYPYNIIAIVLVYLMYSRTRFMIKN